ncbi:unnamed protein product [Cochlearia groenlandica]
MSTSRLILRFNSRPILDLKCLPTTSSYMSRTRKMKCSLRLGPDGHNQRSSFKDKERKLLVEVKAYVPTSEIVFTGKTTQVRPNVMMDLVSLVTQVTNIVLVELRHAIKRQTWKLQSSQIYIEKVIIDCRFFTLFAVAGTLLGSVLCFLEGCSRVLECYTHYLTGSKENTVHMLMEALDMFLFGTSMLVLGKGIYNMFVSCKTNQNMQSIGEAKTRIGYAVVMILHVGMLEKFNTTPLVTCIDLMCFAASLFISSASMFLFSMLSSSLKD